MSEASHKINTVVILPLLFANMESWLQKIIEQDRVVQNHINQLWANSILDFIMPLLRNPINWAPLYLFLIFWLVKNYRQKGVAIIAMLLLLVCITDTISAQILKPWINRLRPCWDEQTSATVRMLTGCGGKYSFPSNHAVNHFAMAMFLFLTIRKITEKPWWWLFAWASAICYAQVYVGKHFPLDVVCGGIIGSIFAWLFFLGTNNILKSGFLNKPFFSQKKKQFSLE